jgi:hypothetical protein
VGLFARVERALLPAAFDVEFDLVAHHSPVIATEAERMRRRNGQPALSEAEGNLLCCLHNRRRAALERRVKLKD